jgi:hypothetical protein
MSLLDLRDALLDVMDDVYHYKAPADKPDCYIVWGEDGGEDVLAADDGHETLVIRGRLYYYTAEEFDTTFDDICTALSGAGAAWSLGEMGYDDTINRFAYELTWRICCGAGEVYQRSRV